MTLEADLQRAVRTRAAIIIPNAAARLSVALDQAEPRRRSGKLHRSKQVRVSIGPNVAQIRAEYTAPQANFTDEGTPRHDIVPRPPRKALAFRVGGRLVIVRKVNHPGNKATRWFRKTVTLTAWRAILRDVTS